MALGSAILTGRQAFYNNNNFTDEFFGQIFLKKSAMVYIFYILKKCRLRMFIRFISHDLLYQSGPRPGAHPIKKLKITIILTFSQSY